MEAIIVGVASVVTVVGFVYAIARNFKIDICLKIDKMESRIDTLEERMFLLATGKSLKEIDRRSHA